MQEIERIKQQLAIQIKHSNQPATVLKNPDWRELFGRLGKLEPSDRAEFGRALNQAKAELEQLVRQRESELTGQSNEDFFDVTAPMDVNSDWPQFPSAERGSLHPTQEELVKMIDIFTRMGFAATESRQLDDDFHMFEALNFPAGHPARDSFDTFKTEEGLIPPAHTSTMQYRVLTKQKDRLKRGEAIAEVMYGRVFRNENVDATHEHTFYQCEGVYVSETASLGQMLGILQHFFESYFEQKLAIRTQPAYFPFVEPGLEFLIEKPASLGGKAGDWLEVLGCGMIHPNVLTKAGIDPAKYQGFAWGGGVDRLVMLRLGVSDVRLFHSGRLEFLTELTSKGGQK